MKKLNARIDELIVKNDMFETLYHFVYKHEKDSKIPLTYFVLNQGIEIENELKLLTKKLKRRQKLNPFRKHRIQN